MENIFDKATADAILFRLEQLQPNSKALWGKMNVAQMLSHLQAPVEVAMGEKTLKRNLIGMLLGGFAKKQLVNDKPFKKSLPTDASYIRMTEHVFDEEKEKLISLFRRFVAGGTAGLIKSQHPFFGKMTENEWSYSLWKHFDHHLRQFGV
jgi:hypothetical protein